MRLLTLALALVCCAPQAHAGIASFVVGYAIGSSGSSSSAQGAQPLLLKSDVRGHDVIVCRTYDQRKCEWGPLLDGVSVTPEQYAGNLGYRTIYSKGAVIAGDANYIAMEVSK